MTIIHRCMMSSAVILLAAAAFGGMTKSEILDDVARLIALVAIASMLIESLVFVWTM